MGLSIRLLGAPRVDCGGEPVRVDTRKAIALLAYLAMTGRPQSRDTLAALLWPEYPQEQARASLRRTLSALLKGLGGRYVHADRSAIALDPADVACDVHRFRALVGEAGAVEPTTRRALLEEAVELAAEPFLHGFSLRDSPEFDDWQFHTAEVLSREVTGALERLTAACAADGDLDAAVAAGRRWSALDPLHEAAHRELMLLYARSGRRAAALRQYRELVRILHRELGVAPLPETDEVYRAVKENRVTAARPASPAEQAAARPAVVGSPSGAGARRAIPPAVPPPSARPAPLPLVERDGALAALLAVHAEAAGGAVAVVEGEAGIGRSRLADELAEAVRGRGGAAVVVRCYDAEQGLAYGPVIAALRAVVEVGDAAGVLGEVSPHTWAEAGRLLPELAARAEGASAPVVDPGTAQARFLEALAALLLAGLAGPVPGVLIVDDAHWADDASAALLSYVSHRLRDVALVCTWRGELVDTAHPLRRLLAAAPTSRTVVLPRLSADAVADLVRGALPAASGEEVARVVDHAEGLPLLVAQYVAAAGDVEGAHGVRDFLRQRIAAVDDAARQLLGTAAVIGRSFDVDTLRAASGRSEEETVAGLERLLRAGLVREQGTTAADYDFAHHRLREEVLASTTLARRRLLHRRIAEALAERAGRQPTPDALAGVAAHYQAAGDDDAAAAHHALAADAARAVFANAEALAHLQAAIALGHPDRAGLHEAVGDLRVLDGGFDDAVTSYETAAALVDPDGLAAVEHKLGTVRHRLGDWDLAEDHYAAALRDLDDDAAAARVLGDWSLTAHRRGDAERARDFAARAERLAASAGDDGALAQAHNLLGVLATAAGDPDGAIAHLRRSLASTAARREPPIRAAALNNLSLAHRAQGDLSAALPLAREALDTAAQIGDRHRQAALESNLADLLRGLGRTEDAERHVRRSVEILAALGGDTPATALPAEVWKLTEW